MARDIAGDGLGERVQYWRRRRGHTQKELAELCGLSPSYLSNIEAGRRRLDSHSWLEQLARVLNVSIPELVGSPYAPTDPGSNAVHAALQPIEHAMVELSLDKAPALVRIRPWSVLAGDVRRLHEALNRAHYETMSSELPGVLAELHAAYIHDPVHRREILIALMHGWRLAAVVTKHLGVRGFPIVAARNAAAVAERLDEPLWHAFAVWLRGSVESQGTRAHQYDLSVTALDHYGIGDCQDHLQVAGMLHLHAALASAALGDAETAGTHLGEARELAERVPGAAGSFAQLHFGTANVGIWEVGIGAELGHGPRVAERAAEVDPRAVPSQARQAMFHADLGRSLIGDRSTRSRGVQALLQAERLAPHRIRSEPLVRDAVLVTWRRARRRSEELSALAHRLGLI